jgi:hypothetical protein
LKTLEERNGFEDLLHHETTNLKEKLRRKTWEKNLKKKLERKTLRNQRKK